MTRSRTLILLALVGAAAAAEPGDDLRRVADLRLYGGIIDRFDVPGSTNDAGQTWDADTTERGRRLGVQFFYSFPDEFEGDVTGPLLGLELSRNTAEHDALKVRADLATVHGGFAYQTDFRPIHIEGTLMLGIGLGHAEGSVDLEAGGVPTGTSADYSDNARAWEAGARLGAFWTFGFGLQLGADIRWVNINTASDMPDGDRHSIQAKGFAAGGSVGWRF